MLRSLSAAAAATLVTLATCPTAAAVTFIDADDDLPANPTAPPSRLSLFTCDPPPDWSPSPSDRPLIFADHEVFRPDLDPPLLAWEFICDPLTVDRPLLHIIVSPPTPLPPYTQLDDVMVRLTPPEETRHF